MNLTIKNFVERNATELGYHIRILHLEKGIDGSLHHAVGVGRAFALGKNVLNADALENGTHGTAGDNTGTGGSRFEKYLGSAVLATLLVGDGALQHRDADKVLLGVVDTFLDGGLDLLGFAEAVADNAVFISNNDNGSKGEGSTTFGDLCNAVDSDKTIFEFDLAGLYSFNVYFCHDLLEF